MSLSAFCDWLSATPFSLYIQNNFWVVPVVQSIHIMAIAVVMASIAMLDLRLVGLLGREQSMRDLTWRFYPWVWRALAVLLVTGILMVIGEPRRELLNFLFWTKMGLIIAALAFTLPVRSMLEERRYRDLAPRKRLILRVCGLVSLALWVAVLSCGRWIAYIDVQ